MYIYGAAEKVNSGNARTYLDITAKIFLEPINDIRVQSSKQAR